MIIDYFIYEGENKPEKNFKFFYKSESNQIKFKLRFNLPIKEKEVGSEPTLTQTSSNNIPLDALATVVGESTINDNKIFEVDFDTYGRDTIELLKLGDNTTDNTYYYNIYINKNNNGGAELCIEYNIDANVKTYKSSISNPEGNCELTFNIPFEGINGTINDDIIKSEGLTLGSIEKIKSQSSANFNSTLAYTSGLPITIGTNVNYLYISRLPNNYDKIEIFKDSNDNDNIKLRCNSIISDDDGDSFSGDTTVRFQKDDNVVYAKDIIENCYINTDKEYIFNLKKDDLIEDPDENIDLYKTDCIKSEIFYDEENLPDVLPEGSTFKEWYDYINKAGVWNDENHWRFNYIISEPVSIQENNYNDANKYEVETICKWPSHTINQGMQIMLGFSQNAGRGIKVATCSKQTDTGLQIENYNWFVYYQDANNINVISDEPCYEDKRYKIKWIWDAPNGNYELHYHEEKEDEQGNIYWCDCDNYHDGCNDYHEIKKDNTFKKATGNNLSLFFGQSGLYGNVYGSLHHPCLNGEIYSLNIKVTKEKESTPLYKYNLIPVYCIDWANTERYNNSTQIKKVFNFYDTEGKKLMWRPNDDTSDIIGAERSEWVDISNIMMNTENNKSQYLKIFDKVINYKSKDLINISNLLFKNDIDYYEFLVDYKSNEFKNILQMHYNDEIFDLLCKDNNVEKIYVRIDNNKYNEYRGMITKDNYIIMDEFQECDPFSSNNS